jgi:hypothetical protein
MGRHVDLPSKKLGLADNDKMLAYVSDDRSCHFHDSLLRLATSLDYVFEMLSA